MHFEISGPITGIQTIASGSSIRILPLLQKEYGEGRWRKLKGIATVRLGDGTLHLAEVHWFEAHGIGKKKMRIKSDAFVKSPVHPSIPQGERTIQIVSI